jgi:hypothetical protein
MYEWSITTRSFFTDVSMKNNYFHIVMQFIKIISLLFKVLKLW